MSQEVENFPTREQYKERLLSLMAKNRIPLKRIKRKYFDHIVVSAIHVTENRHYMKSKVLIPELAEDLISKQLEESLSNIRYYHAKDIIESKIPKHWSKEFANKYLSYYDRSCDKQTSWGITYEMFETLVTNSVCVYCGTSNKIGIDRIDNNKGYTKSNIQPCCGKCNMMKYTHTDKDFISHLQTIINYRRIKTFAQQLPLF